DAALADGGWRLTPRNFRQQEAWLLKAERDWRDGGDVGYVQAQLQQLKDQAASTRNMPAPEVHSLALAGAIGEKEDKEINKALLELFSTLRSMKATDPARVKLAEDFRSKFVKAPPTIRAAAVLQQLAIETDPNRETVELLDLLAEPDATKRPR